MLDRLKELLAKVVEWWNRFTTRQKTTIIVMAAGSIFLFALILYFVNKPQYTLLMTCDSQKKATEVMDILDNANIKHQESADLLRISVETNQMASAQYAIASAGYTPDQASLSSAIGGGISTTAADKEKLYQDYMEKYIAQTILSQSAIKDCKIHLNIPKQTGTLSDVKKESGAFIQLTLGDTFTPAQAANLARAVATCLGNDTTAKITILDSESNLLFAGGDDYSTAGVASSLLELQNQAESMVSSKVQRVFYGTNQFDMVDVTSFLQVDFSSYEKTIKEYYANDGRDEGMYAEQDTYSSTGTNTTGGDPGTDSNDGTSIMWQDQSNSSSETSETHIAYLPNEMASHVLQQPGVILYGQSSLSLSAITYREIREEDVARQGFLDGGVTWEDYKLANGGSVKLEVDPEYYTMVANATGISADKITILAYEIPVFYDKESMKLNWDVILSIVMLLIIIGLLAFVVLRSMKSKEEPEEAEEISVEKLISTTPEAELEDIDMEAKSEARKIIEKFVDENPEAAAALLRNWLTEDW